jgi:hypothetical protein
MTTSATSTALTRAASQPTALLHCRHRPASDRRLLHHHHPRHRLTATETTVTPTAPARRLPPTRLLPHHRPFTVVARRCSYQQRTSIGLLGSPRGSTTTAVVAPCPSSTRPQGFQTSLRLVVVMVVVVVTTHAPRADGDGEEGRDPWHRHHGYIPPRNPHRRGSCLFLP